MADWLYIGYCTVMAMFAVAAAYAAAFGLRALRRLPRSLLLGFAAAAVVATLTAQKTNNVPPNMNQPQMMQGGVSQTGLTGLPFPVPPSPFPVPWRQPRNAKFLFAAAFSVTFLPAGQKPLPVTLPPSAGSARPHM